MAVVPWTIEGSENWTLMDVAQLEYSESGLRGEPMFEQVALGFVTPFGEIIWHMLENVARRRSHEERGEFYVEPTEIARAMNAAATDERMSPDFLGKQGRMLWHTHTKSQSPSREDIAEFPDWLCSYGMVYHVPSGNLCVYNGGGIISNTSVSSNPFATPGDVPHG